MRALSIRQPYAELILRWIKPIEFRSRATRIFGEQVPLTHTSLLRTNGGNLIPARYGNR